MLELCIMVIYLVSYFCKALHSRTNGFLYWYSCIPSCIYSRYSIRAQVFTLQVRHQTHAHSFDYSLYHTFPWYYLTSGLNCIVHWTICQDIYLCPWSCIYSTCWWLYLESFFFYQQNISFSYIGVCVFWVSIGVVFCLLFNHVETYQLHIIE